MPYQIEVGAQVVEFPDSVGQDEAQRVLSEQFPATGEDIAGAMQDPTFTPTKSDYLKYEEYSKTKQTDWLNTAAQAADAVIGIIGGAISEGAQGAVGNPRNYIEAFAQGTRQLYGLAAQSQDPSSALFRFKDLVAGTGTSDSRYAQFLDAREFGKKSSQLERGETGITFPPELTNPEFVQGLSTILDPTLIIPGVGEMFGMGKLTTRAVGKGAQLTGRAVAGVAKPLERFAGAAERIAAETVGMTPEALRSTAATAGIAGALGIAPEVATLAAIPAGIRTAREAGEALSRAGENLMTQPSRIGPLEAIGAAPGANMRQRILGVIGQYGGDAALDASLRGLAGGIEGAAIGTGLGYLSGGQEGAASGLGAGVAQGAVGALGARGLQKLTGAAAKQARAGDLGRFIDSQQDPTTKALFERVRDQHGVDAASSLMDLQGLVRGKFGDVEVIYRNNKDFADQFGGTARGVQVDDLGGRPAVVINADIIGKGTGDGPLYTLGHELFHALEKSTQLEGGATEIKDSLVGRWIQEGDVVRKLSEGAFNDAEIDARFNEYRDKLSAGNQERADQLAQYDTIDKKAGYVASELAAEHFASLLAGQKPDALLKGFTGLTRQLLDSALTQNASRALADAAATIGRTFGVKPTDSVLFPDLKQASPQVNAMLRDLLRARRKLDERITIENDGPGKVLKPQDVSNPIAAKQLIDLGVAEQMPDGSVRNLSDQEINAREEKDTTAIRSILEGVPGARVVDGEILGRFSPQQLSAIEMSQAVSSRMKDKIRAVNAAMDAGNSIFVNYGAATKRVKNRQTGKFTSKYNSGIRLSQREVLPYSFYLSKADNPVIKAIDISKIRGALDKLTAPDGSVAKGIWGSVDGFMSDLAGYFTNLDAGEGARRSAEIFGLEKAKYLGDFVNEQEKGGRKFVRDFRLDRIGSTTPMDFRARISEDAIQKSKMRWMPAENLGDKSIINSEEGYRIISGAKHKLYGTDGKLIGIYDTQTQAERKAERDYTIQKQSTRTWFDSNYDSWKKAQSMRTEFTPEERNAVSIAKKKSIETFRKYPEAIRLDIKVDREGNPKFEQVLDANENPVVDANGKPVMEVAFTKVPYDLLGSPKLSKNKDRAVVQAADLLDADARKAFNNPDISKGIGWYSRMREFLQQQFGANIEVFGQLLGATSARTPVDTNFKQALEALKLLSTGQYDGLLAEFSKHANKTYTDSQSGELLKQWQAKNPDKRASAFKVDDEVRKQINKFEGVPLRPNGKKYNANSQKVLHVLYGLWLDQTVGPKTPNFAGNLTGRTLKATIDVWAARNLRRLLYEGAREKWRPLPEQESGVTDPDFFFAQDVYEVVGKRLGMNPDDLQALMWFMEKDVWEKNGWTSTVGAEKSSFDKEAGKLALDRYQAGVTTFTELKNFKFDTQEKERLALRKSIIGLEGLVASRVNNSSGLYDGVFEPSLDIEFSVSKNRDGSTKSIANQILEIIRVANQPERLQKDVFISQIVPIDHPNARPIMEVGFKKGAAWDDIADVVTAFQKNGIDGFTIATDNQGNVIGIRAQYLPEFSAVFDSLDHLDPAIVDIKMQDWVSRVNAASTALDQIDNVSYKKNGTVSTIVYGFEEYATARPIEPESTSRAAELGRRRPIAEQRRQVSSGSDAGQAVEPGSGGLPTPAGDVQSAGSSSSQEVGGQRFMPAQEGFYSKLEEVVNAKLPKLASPQQVLASVDPAKGSGVKPEELKWTGFAQAVERIAKENGGKVPKDLLIKHLNNEGAVKFEEVIGQEKTVWEVGDSGYTENYTNLKDALNAKENVIDLIEKEIRNQWGVEEQDDSFIIINDRGDKVGKQRSESGRVIWEPSYYRSEAEAEAAIEKGSREIAESTVVFNESIDKNNLQYSDYQLDGGENYREVVLTSDNAKPYTSSHFENIRNYVAHMRLNENIDAKGKEGLFIEEIQSDRHQEARKQGYKGEVDTVDVINKLTREQAIEIIKRNEGGNDTLDGNESVESLRDTVQSYLNDEGQNETGETFRFLKNLAGTDGIPDAPFRKDWSLQMFKRALRDAVTSGKQWIGWTTGETQANRFDLSKQVDVIKVSRGGGKTWEISADKDGRQVVSKDVDTIAQVESMIGKELASKVADMPPGEQARSFSGLDLKLGSEGMKGFYDKILPSEVQKYVKQWGAEVSKSNIAKTEIWRVDITPQMRESITKIGQARFMPSDTDYLSAVKQGDTKAAQRMVDEAAKAAGYTVGPMWHGSPSSFNIFQKTKDPLGFHFGNRDASNQAKSTTGKKGEWKTRSFFLNIKNPLRLPDLDSWNFFDLRSALVDTGVIPEELPAWKIESEGRGDLRKGLVKRIQQAGYDGVVYKNKFEGVGDSLIAFDPSQIKSADPITKDNTGNVIPLSQRFKATSEDIRFMPSTIQREMGRNVDFANPPTDSEAVDALSSEKKAKFGAARNIKPGTQVAARIDIPAFLRTGKYVVAVHEPDGEAGGPGKVIGYDTVTRLQNPKFVVKQGVQRIYEGKSKKFPVATVDGKIMADRSIPADLENYVAVGMDPKEHAYFYDKRTDQPVKSGSEAVSVGNTVFVKNPVYGKPEDFRFMPQPDAAMPGAYSFPGGYRALPGKAKGSLRLYGPAGSLVGIASSLDEAQRILRRKTK